jgi:hypothetical protein
VRGARRQRDRGISTAVTPVGLGRSGQRRAYAEREQVEFGFHDSDSLWIQYAPIEPLN